MKKIKKINNIAVYKRLICLAAVLAEAVCIVFMPHVNTGSAESGGDTYGLTLSQFAAVGDARREKISQGVSNIIKRGRQMYEIEWTPLEDIVSYPGSGDEAVFRKGTVYKGIPYGQPVHNGKYVGFGVSIEDFAAASAEADSIFYTERGENTWYYTEGLGDIKYGPYYSSDCSAFISYVWDLPERFTTSMIAERTVRPSELGYKNAMFQYVGHKVSDLRTGYALNKGGSHIILVYDVLYDAGGNIIQVTTLEQTPPIMRLRVWGAGGNAGSLEDLQNKIDSAPYDIIKYKDMDSVVYSESPAVPLNTETYISRITEPVSMYEENGSISARAYTNGTADAGVRLSGYTYHKEGVLSVEYTTDNINWIKAETETCAELTCFNADLPGTSSSYTVHVRALYPGGMYDIAEITVNGGINDVTYLSCFDSIGGISTAVCKDEPYVGEIELSRASGMSVPFTGWAICTDGIKGFEYKIDDGMWIETEANFRYDVYNAYKAYGDVCNVYNQLSGGADFSLYDKGSEHVLHLRAVSDSGAGFEIARVKVRIKGDTVNIFGIEIAYSVIIAVSAAVCLIAAASVTIIMNHRADRIKNKKHNSKICENNGGDEKV